MLIPEYERHVALYAREARSFSQFCEQITSSGTVNTQAIKSVLDITEGARKLL